ncbi:hypothetical protein ACE193_00965 [Bernardetia sp. OM2101]|uniref:hypothetical protein n=1 Tax=Bernardetia sp. OM2101 TaxID=3344876 RepID=UPI0035CF9E55
MSEINSYKDFTIGIMVNLLIAEVFLLGKTSNFLNVSSNNNQEVVGKFIMVISINVIIFIVAKRLLERSKMSLSNYLVFSYLIVPLAILILYEVINLTSALITNNTYSFESNLILIIFFAFISWLNLYTLFFSNELKTRPNLCLLLSFLNYFFVGFMLWYVEVDNNVLDRFSLWFQEFWSISFTEPSESIYLNYALLDSAFLSFFTSILFHIVIKINKKQNK